MNIHYFDLFHVIFFNDIVLPKLFIFKFIFTQIKVEEKEKTELFFNIILFSIFINKPLPLKFLILYSSF